MLLYKGYKNTSINEICKGAGIPKGSFYYYFGSKDDFVSELIDYYYGFMFSVQEKYLNMDGLSYIDRLKGYYEEFRNYFLSKNCSGGCPIGNLAQENSEITHELDVEEFADFIFNSWEGSLLRMKVTKNMAPMELFEKVVFNIILNNYRLQKNVKKGLQASLRRSIIVSNVKIE